MKAKTAKLSPKTNPKKPGLKAVLFDLDGTLIDSIPYHVRSFELAFKDIGLKVPKRTIPRITRKPTEEVYFELNVRKKTGVELEKFIDLKRKHYYSLIRGRRILFPEALPLLSALKRKGLRLCLVTNSSRLTTINSAPKLLLKKFKAIITYDDVLHGKPAPEPYLLALKRLRLKTENCVVVGDSTMDVLSARKAGMKCISVTGGASTTKQLRSSKPWKIVSGLEEVLPELKKSFAF